MKVIWSIVLLVSLCFAVAVPLFAGHWLVERHGPALIISLVCLAIATALFYVQIKYNRDSDHAHH